MYGTSHIHTHAFCSMLHTYTPLHLQKRVHAHALSLMFCVFFGATFTSVTLLILWAFLLQTTALYTCCNTHATHIATHTHCSTHCNALQYMLQHTSLQHTLQRTVTHVCIQPRALTHALTHTYTGRQALLSPSISPLKSKKRPTEQKIENAIVRAP